MPYKDPEVAKQKAKERYKRNNPNAYTKPRFSNQGLSRKDAAENSRMRYRYGIDLNQYKQISEDQYNKCKLCGKEEMFKNKLAIDHCHKTGKVRGLLCFKCNTALGKFENEPYLLIRAYHYIVHEGDIVCRQE